MRTPPLGKLELEVYRHIAEKPALTVGEAAEQFGVPRGLARTTVSTVMENLRKKGYLKRALHRGVFRYSATIGRDEVLRSLVKDFVDETLGGSVSPFVAYLAETNDLSDDELATLHKLLHEPEEPQGKLP